MSNYSTDSYHQHCSTRLLDKLQPHPKLGGAVILYENISASWKGKKHYLQTSQKTNQNHNE